MEAPPGTCQPYLKALSDATRWQMVEVLIASPSAITLGELAQRIGVSNYNASRHTSILEEVGILESRRVGRNKLLSVSAELRESIEKGDGQAVVLNLGCCTFQFPAQRSGEIK